MTNGEDMENGPAKDIPPWLQPVPEEELQATSLVSGKLKIAIIAGALVILSLFVAVIFYLYSDTTPSAPIHVEAPKTAVKGRPADRGGMEVEHQDKVIFDQRDGVKTGGEVKLEPQAEMPLEAIPEDQAEELEDDPIAEAIEAVTEDASPNEAEQSSSVSAEPQAPAAEKTEDPAEQAAAVPSMENAYRVQLGAFGSEVTAQRSWRTVRGQFAAYLGDKSVDYEPVQAGDRTLYRLRAGPFADRASADQVCLALRAQEQACIVVNP
jgi:cell division septation protein DedD